MRGETPICAELCATALPRMMTSEFHGRPAERIRGERRVNEGKTAKSQPASLYRLGGGPSPSHDVRLGTASRIARYRSLRERRRDPWAEQAGWANGINTSRVARSDSRQRVLAVLSHFSKLFPSAIALCFFGCTRITARAERGFQFTRRADQRTPFQLC